MYIIVLVSNSSIQLKNCVILNAPVTMKERGTHIGVQSGHSVLPGRVRGPIWIPAALLWVKLPPAVPGEAAEDGTRTASLPPGTTRQMQFLIPLFGLPNASWWQRAGNMPAGQRLSPFLSLSHPLAPCLPIFQFSYCILNKQYFFKK